MIARLRGKPLVIGVLSLVAAGLLLAVAIPALAAGPAPGQARGPFKGNIAQVQGTLGLNADGTVTVTPANGGTPVTLTVSANTTYALRGVTLSAGPTANATATAPLIGPVNVLYNSQTKAANHVMLGIPSTTRPAPGTARPPVSGNVTRVQGTLALNPDGSITVSPANSGTPVTLTVSANTTFDLHGVNLSAGPTATAPVAGTVNVIYNSQKVAGRIMMSVPNLPRPAPGKSGPPANANIKHVQGTIQVNQGSISINPPNGSTPVPLKFGPDTNLVFHGVTSFANGQTAAATYDSATGLVIQVIVNMPGVPNTFGAGARMPGRPGPGPCGMPGAPWGRTGR